MVLKIDFKAIFKKKKKQKPTVHNGKHSAHELLSGNL